MVVLICSQFLPGENIAKEEQKGILPIAASPEATVTKFCSATPTCTNLSGNFSVKGLIPVLSDKSAESPTMFLLLSAACVIPCPKPFLVGTCSQSALNIFGFNFNFGLSIKITQILRWAICF